MDGRREPKHCDHCAACREVWLGTHTSTLGVTWPDGHCPYHAEAERIAEALQRLHGVVDHDCQSQEEHDGLLRAQDAANAVARGET